MVLEEGIQSYDDLKALFPDDYVFMQFSEYEVYDGLYTLAPLDFASKLNERSLAGIRIARNIVAMPAELKGRVPLSNSD